MGLIVWQAQEAHHQIGVIPKQRASSSAARDLARSVREFQKQCVIAMFLTIRLEA
jgi:hypothetical protein